MFVTPTRSGFSLLPRVIAKKEKGVLDTFDMNVRLPWRREESLIPSGWSRDTDLDNTYLQGGPSDYSGPQTGGSAAHDHTQDAHTHVGSDHTHNSYSGAKGFGLLAFIKTSGRPTAPLPAASETHSHLSRTSPSTSLDYESGGSLTLNATADDRPESIRVIFIKPNDGNQGMPDLASCYTDEPTVPDGFNTDSNYLNKFMIGALAGGNGGGTLGADDHTHTSNPSHSHTIPAHGHASHVLGAGTAANVFTTGATSGCINQSHHNGTYESGFSGSSGLTSADSDSKSNRPAYTTLLGITSDNGKIIAGIVVPFIGAIADIPKGWILMDGTGDSIVNCLDVQIMCETDPGAIGGTGGEDVHKHIMAHVHSSIGNHNHVLTVSAGGTILSRTSSFLTKVTKNANHAHTWTDTSTNPNDSDSTNAVSQGTDIRYNYQTVILIKKV